MKILLAVDGSKFTKRMLGYVAAHDEMFGPDQTYHVLTVITPVTPRAAAVLGKAAVQEYYEQSAEDIFKPVRAFFDKRGLKAKFYAKKGYPGDVIAEEATDMKAHLLVMGSHGHGALGSLVMGSVASRVLASCKTPVLLVR